MAAPFLGGALVVEGDELFEDLLVGQRLWPAVSFEDQTVEPLV
jgi:hypothetical protein